MKTLREQFDSYSAEVIPADAPDVQREECLLAFMAGAVAAKTLASRGVDTQPELQAFMGRMILIAEEQDHQGGAQ